ncbi:hypothetical protein EDD86DRAFT_278709 [Gorgonomyces haynaldii]|nr:hypothetical protein EDD86DRAFT_278709 [Gorgonomyces haynaldii]
MAELDVKLSTVVASVGIFSNLVVLWKRRAKFYRLTIHSFHTMLPHLLAVLSCSLRIYSDHIPFQRKIVIFIDNWIEISCYIASAVSWVGVYRVFLLWNERNLLIVQRIIYCSLALVYSVVLFGYWLQDLDQYRDWELVSRLSGGTCITVIGLVCAYTIYYKLPSAPTELGLNPKQEFSLFSYLGGFVLFILAYFVSVCAMIATSTVEEINASLIGTSDGFHAVSVAIFNTLLKAAVDYFEIESSISSQSTKESPKPSPSTPKKAISYAQSIISTNVLSIENTSIKPAIRRPSISRRPFVSVSTIGHGTLESVASITKKPSDPVAGEEPILESLPSVASEPLPEE